MIAAIVLLLASCATTRPADPPREESLPMLFTENGNLGWAGITLRMPRSEVERRLGKKLRVLRTDYFEMCGEHYTDVMIRGRSVEISWTSAAPDGVVELITIPYAGSERTAYDSDLSAAARKAVPELIDPHGTPAGECPDPHPSYLVLRGSPEQAVNLKSSGEGVFFLTEQGCVD